MGRLAHLAYESATSLPSILVSGVHLMATEQPHLMRSSPSPTTALPNACPGPHLSVTAHSIAAVESEKMVHAFPVSCHPRNILIARCMAKSSALKTSLFFSMLPESPP